MTLAISKEQARKFLIRYHHLTSATELKNDADILAFVKKVGCLQFDPLDAVGKNPDLVLQSRAPHYRKGALYPLIYEQKALIDVWDKNMSICRIEDWPYFSRNRANVRPKLKKLKKGATCVREYLEKNESACSSDFDLNETVEWHWSKARLSTLSLEYMNYAGEIVVCNKKGTRRYFTLAENFIPADILSAPDPNASDADYDAWIVLRRINSIGMLWNRGGDAWLGLQNFKSMNRERGFAALLEAERIEPINVEDIDFPLYIAKENLPLLQESQKEPDDREEIRILAPLDNLIWERRLIEELFHFYYRWEIYVPAGKRQYGYYVLPILYGSRFIGRIEMKTDKANDSLLVQNFWWEEKTGAKQKIRSALKKALKRFAAYNLCKNIVYETEI